SPAATLSGRWLEVGKVDADRDQEDLGRLDAAREDELVHLRVRDLHPRQVAVMSPQDAECLVELRHAGCTGASVEVGGAERVARSLPRLAKEGELAAEEGRLSVRAGQKPTVGEA